jgi:hypothetical protein
MELKYGDLLILWQKAAGVQTVCLPDIFPLGVGTKNKGNEKFIMLDIPHCLYL